MYQHADRVVMDSEMRRDDRKEDHIRGLTAEAQREADQQATSLGRWADTQMHHFGGEDKEPEILANYVQRARAEAEQAALQSADRDEVSYIFEQDDKKEKEIQRLTAETQHLAEEERSITVMELTAADFAEIEQELVEEEEAVQATPKRVHPDNQPEEVRFSSSFFSI